MTALIRAAVEKLGPAALIYIDDTIIGAPIGRLREATLAVITIFELLGIKLSRNKIHSHISLNDGDGLELVNEKLRILGLWYKYNPEKLLIQPMKFHIDAALQLNNMILNSIAIKKMIDVNDVEKLCGIATWINCMKNDTNLAILTKRATRLIYEPAL